MSLLTVPVRVGDIVEYRDELWVVQHVGHVMTIRRGMEVRAALPSSLGFVMSRADAALLGWDVAS